MGDNEEDVLQKADALMRRHRVFVASAAEAPDSAPETPTEDADDIPVLTEVVPLDAATPPASASVQIDPAQLRAALAAELDTWLDEDLPAHVMRVLDGITDQLIGHLATKARDELLARLEARLEAAVTAPAQGSDEA